MCYILGIETKSIPEGALREAFDRTISRGPDMSRLVELPCVGRNVIGAMNALSAAELALAGAASPIPCDEVIDAMRAVGDQMPTALKETGGGGIAATPTGRRIAEQMRSP